MIDVDFSVCENPEVILGLLGSSDRSQMKVALPVDLPGTPQLMYAFLSA